MTGYRTKTAIVFGLLGVSISSACAEPQINPTVIIPAKPEEASVSFTITTEAPQALERAVNPYRLCLTSWSQGKVGVYEKILSGTNVRNGPPECAEARARSVNAGFDALNPKWTEELRRELVQKQLLAIDIAILSGRLWTSQSLSENSAKQ